MPKLTIHPSVRLCDRHAVPTLLKSFRRFWNNSRTQIRHNEQVGSQYFKIVKQTFGPRTSTPWRQPFCLTDCRGRGGEGVLGKCHLRSEIYLNIFVQKVSSVFVSIVVCFCLVFRVNVFVLPGRSIDWARARCVRCGDRWPCPWTFLRVDSCQFNSAKRPSSSMRLSKKSTLLPFIDDRTFAYQMKL